MSAQNDKLKFTTLDVFTSTRYEGNPLAIVELPATVTLSQEQKQLIAKEFNLSETVFLHVHDRADSENSWQLDIFTISQEVPFAGHPTIGSACYALQAASKGSSNQIKGSFRCKAGQINLNYNPVTNEASAEIPHNIRIHKETYPRARVVQSQRNIEQPPDSSPIVSIVKGMTFCMVELSSMEELGRVALPQMIDDVELDEGWESFVCVYFFVRSESTPEQGLRIYTRMLENNWEDAATGSAASALASYLALTDGKPGETRKYQIVQGVHMGRKSVIGIEVMLDDQGKVKTVLLSGTAVEVMTGQITIPK